MTDTVSVILASTLKAYFMKAPFSSGCSTDAQSAPSFSCQLPRVSVRCFSGAVSDVGHVTCPCRICALVSKWVSALPARVPNTLFILWSTREPHSGPPPPTPSFRICRIWMRTFVTRQVFPGDMGQPMHTTCLRLFPSSISQSRDVMFCKTLTYIFIQKSRRWCHNIAMSLGMIIFILSLSR